jgi:hypothetical protein
MELEAETTAWQVSNESVDAFEKKQHGKGLSADALKEITDLRVKEFAEQKRAEYEKEFRALYKRMLSESQSSQP